MEIFHFEDLGDTNVVSECSLGVNLVIDNFCYVSSGKLHLVGFPLLKSYNTTRYCSVYKLSQPGGVYISQYPRSLQYLQVLHLCIQFESNRTITYGDIA